MALKITMKKKHLSNQKSISPRAGLSNFDGRDRSDDRLPLRYKWF
jgi:hypothetical protein